MASNETSGWGMFSRLVVIAVAIMVVAVAAKPYQGRFRPYLDQIKNMRFEPVKIGQPDTGESAKSGAARAQKPQDSISEGDRNELKAVLNRL